MFVSPRSGASRNVAQKGHHVGVGLFLFGGECAPKHGLDTQRCKQVCRDVDALQPLRRVPGSDKFRPVPE